MTPEQVKSTYRRMIAAGQKIIVRRYTGTGTNRRYFDVEVRARPLGQGTYTVAPKDMAGDIQQREVKMIVLVEDLITKQFAIPILRTDKVVYDGVEFNIDAVDVSTRRIEGKVIAYEFRLVGGPIPRA